MNRLQKTTAVVLGATAGIWALEPLESGFFFGFSASIGEAQARVGRPLTPVSYAGVARRSVRRVARRTAVRVSTLPAGCVYGPYYGANYWRCGGAYYTQSGNVYVQVVFD